MKARQLVGSMSRNGNCHGDALAERFIQLLKRERINLIAGACHAV